VKRRWYLLIAPLVPVAGAVLAWAAPDIALPPVARWLDVGQTPRSVDYVVELPGDADRRPFVVAALLKAGLARAAVVPHTADSPEEALGILPDNTEVMRRVLRYRGVPEDRLIVLQGASEHTAGDLQLVAAFLREHPAATVAVVTSACHTRRARWAFRRLLGAEIAKRTIFVSAPNPEFQASNWWTSPLGVQWVVSEYVKLVAYWYVYGSGCLWTAGLVAAVVSVLLWRRMARRRTIEAPSRAVANPGQATSRQMPSSGSVPVSQHPEPTRRASHKS